MPDEKRENAGSAVKEINGGTSQVQIGNTSD